MELECVAAAPSDLDQVVRLYAAAGYRGGVDPLDVVLVAKTIGAVIGAVRLCREEGVIVLRGMQVQPACQRQRVGARLLAACGPVLAQGMAFCLPYRHLAGFYAAAGFEVVGADGLPDFLARRLASYLSLIHI